MFPHPHTRSFAKRGHYGQIASQLKIRGFDIKRSEASLRLTADALPASAEQRTMATTSIGVVYIAGIMSKISCVDAVIVEGQANES